MNIVEEYSNVQKNIFNYFEVKEDYYIFNALDFKWKLVNDEEHSLLTILKSNDKQEHYVTTRKDDSALVYKKENYSMIIGIDCIKVAFILKNSNDIS